MMEYGGFIIDNERGYYVIKDKESGKRLCALDTLEEAKREIDEVLNP